MRAKLRRTGLRIGLVALLILLGSVPITLRYLPPQPPTAHDFNSAQQKNVLPSSLLSTEVGSLVQEENAAEARRALEMIGGLPPDIEHDLRTYVTMVQELRSILGSAKLGLDQIQEMIADGAVIAAQEKARELEGLLDDASRRLDMLFASLDQAEALYGPLDLSDHRALLETFLRKLSGFKQLLTKLNALIAPEDVGAETRLDLSVWPKPVWVCGTLHVLAQLSSKDGVLPGRAVELWINGTATRLTLDQTGQVIWEYYVSSNERLNSLELYARFTPTGEDYSIYRPARSATQIVPVEYYPVVLTSMSSLNAFHVLENFTVQAKLTDASARGLVQETVEIMIDDRSVGSCATDSVGECSIVASFPSGTPEGRHELYARFEPRQGVYASAISERTSIELYYLKPTIDLIALGGLTRVWGDNLAISGQTLYVESRLEIDSKPLAEGLLVAFLGERELARAISGSDGIFRIVINLPLDATGDQTLTLVSVPGKQWMTGSVTSLVLKIVNSPIMFLGLGAVISSIMVLSGRSLDFRSMLRRPRESEKSGEPKAEREKAESKEEEAGPAPVAFRLDYLKGLDDARTCLRETYWETRRVLGAFLQDAGDRSETHREYERRVSGRLADAAKSFSELTGLFELAEYSQHQLSRVEADEAINHAVVIAEATNVEAKQ